MIFFNKVYKIRLIKLSYALLIIYITILYIYYLLDYLVYIDIGIIIVKKCENQ